MKKIYRIARILVVCELVVLLAGFTLQKTPVVPPSPYGLDPDPPVAICQDTVWVSTDINGIAEIPAIDFDNGSTDECPPLTFAARRVQPNCDGSNDDFSPTVSFCCADTAYSELLVTLLVVDGVGNFSSCQSVVVINTGPTVECEPVISVVIPPNTGFAELTPDSLLANAWDNCGGEIVALSFSADTTDQLAVLTCDDLCTNPNPVELWVTDDAGNQSFCESAVIVQDDFSVCGPCNAYIAGLTITENDEAIAGVAVELNDGQYIDTTDATGFYEFDIPLGVDAWVAPHLDTMPLELVTTFDMVLIQRHILGITPFDSPYKRIAADANNSGSITTLDLLVLQQLILGLIDTFPNNTSWRFVEASYEFPNPNNPWQEPFPEGILIEAGQTVLEADFIGVKIGNVN